MVERNVSEYIIYLFILLQVFLPCVHATLYSPAGVPPMCSFHVLFSCRCSFHVLMPRFILLQVFLPCVHATFGDSSCVWLGSEQRSVHEPGGNKETEETLQADRQPSHTTAAICSQETEDTATAATTVGQPKRGSCDWYGRSTYFICISLFVSQSLSDSFCLNCPFQTVFSVYQFSLSVSLSLSLSRSVSLSRSLSVSTCFSQLNHLSECMKKQSTNPGTSRWTIPAQMFI